MTEKPGKIVLAGGSGFLGQVLAKSFLADGYEVVVLSRSSNGESEAHGRRVQWDAQTPGCWVEELKGARALFNLTGRSVDCRYTKRNRDLILNSRVDSTRVLGKVISSLDHPPEVWLNASTATIYNDRRGDLPPHDEFSEGNAQGFSEEVGRAWERAFFECKHPNVRQVAMRITIVLGEGGGAFPVMRRFAKLGLGGFQGPGSQWISWLHVRDWVGIARFLVENESIEGAINLAAPEPVTNADFMREMRKQFAPMGLGLPAPTPLVHLGAFIMGTSAELVLKSRKVISSKLEQSGYSFAYPNISDCLRHLAG